MIRIEDSVEVAASPADSFAFVTRIEGYPAWLPGVVRAEPLDPANGEAVTIRQGSRFRLVSSGPGGMEIVSTGRVEALDPPRSITIDASSGLFGLTATCTVEVLGETRSRIIVRAAVEPRGLATLASGRIEKELRAAVPDTLRRLRETVEAPPAE
ncbi:MAG: SRPBCC family protein [Chloroflexota bacterium]